MNIVLMRCEIGAAAAIAEEALVLALAVGSHEATNRTRDMWDRSASCEVFRDRLCNSE